MAITSGEFRLTCKGMELAEPGAPQIGPVIQRLRKQKSLTLDQLAKLSGVSRSMLSQVERGQTNPTLSTVWMLAEALKTDVSELIGGRQSGVRVAIDIATASFTPQIRTEDGLCVLRILSPADRADSVEWYELRFSPGGALMSAPHAKGMREHLTVLDGEIEVVAGDERSVIAAGSTARYPADVSHEIRNIGATDARALLVVIS